MRVKANNISCCILAGGMNLRMGKHKAFLKIGGKRIIDILLDTVSKWFTDIKIITNDRSLFKEFPYIDIVEDIIKEKGPIGGLYTALKVTDKEGVFCLPCDMPFVDERLIAAFIEEGFDNGFDTVVAAGERGIEPLAALYNKRLADLAERNITIGRLKVSDLFKDCKARYIDLRLIGSDILNLNTPEEYYDYACKIKSLV